MKIGYRRDLNRNYLIVSEIDDQSRAYEIRMFEKNGIRGFLPLQVRRVNGQMELWLDISGKQSVELLFENRLMSGADMENLLHGISESMEEGGRYLLDSRGILLLPEYIYLDQDNGNVFLCCIPGSDEGDNCRKLGEYVLKHLDHSDSRAVRMGYAFYAQTLEENFSFSAAVQSALQAAREEKGRLLKGGTDALPYHESRSAEETALLKTAHQTGIRTHAPARQPEEQNLGREENDPGEESSSDSILPETFTVQSRGTKSRKKRRNKEVKGILLFVIIIAALSVLYVGIVFLTGMDLSQAGGLGFLFVAVIWLVFRQIQKRSERKRNRWSDTDEEPDYEDEEDELMAALMEDMPEDAYPEMLNAKKTENGAENGMEKKTGAAETGFREPGGKTRILSVKAAGPRLVSCADGMEISLDKPNMIVGKSAGQADICIASDVVSRIHARIEQIDGCAYVTDLNSTNGTSLNGKILMPGEKMKAEEGDEIAFAGCRYILR